MRATSVNSASSIFDCLPHPRLAHELVIHIFERLDRSSKIAFMSICIGVNSASQGKWQEEVLGGRIKRNGDQSI